MANINALLELWKKEGFIIEKLKEEFDPKDKQFKWLLFRIYGDSFYDDYGRHAVLQVLCLKETGEIVNFEIFNVSERWGENPYDFPCVGDDSWKV